MRTPPPRRPTQAVQRPGCRTVVVSRDASGTYQLSDGRVLLNPHPVAISEVKVGNWVAVNGHPYEIGNMQARAGGAGGGRILHLNGTHLVLRLRMNDEVHLFTVLDTRATKRK